MIVRLLAAAAALLTPNMVAAQPDGRLLVEQNCGTCHTLRKGQGSADAPNLHGMIGRQAGTAPGYRYSRAFMAAFRGRRWTPELMDAWIADSQAVAPNSGMVSFHQNSKERSSIVKYLTTLR